MALLSFHYLITAFGFTVFTHAPAVVMAAIFILQGIMYIAGIAVSDYDEYIFWDMLVTLAGVLVGTALLIVTRAPQMLAWKASYVAVWGQFALWAIFYLAAQLFYAFFPPPAYPWGIIGTAVSGLLIQGLLWFAMYYNTAVFGQYTGRKYFFGLWMLILFVMEMCYFLAYVLDELWVSFIAAGAGAVILIIVALVFPISTPYKVASPVSMEPLINPAAKPQPGDDTTY